MPYLKQSEFSTFMLHQPLCYEEDDTGVQGPITLTTAFNSWPDHRSVYELVNQPWDEMTASRRRTHKPRVCHTRMSVCDVTNDVIHCFVKRSPEGQRGTPFLIHN